MEKRRRKNFGQVGGRLAAKASLVQREVARRSRDGGIVGRYYDLVLSLFSYGASLQSPNGGAESPSGDLATPTGEMILWHDLRHQSLRFAPRTIASLYTREAMVRCPPLTQGSLRGGAVPAGGKNEGNSENSPLTGREGFGMIVK